ncbi:LacI family DNA-binding transcriptional regulator [Rathayibacter oskolensis]|uniref:LacI family DNA-binding transcriptional regulator n=1 Tax=Rathayibacter oskolensis TaxID=1891671 RepID=UPI00265F1F29|nr:LacI family DNA-binding transcriptional regulator [Rathayibacter oskolensis]WKK72578.1 LacI family DNA-binding transcriptional regulator [Rathayibacter oskolensis]
MVDVARLAGVSQQTVSRVVNGSDNVAPEIRERVERAIAQLRYRRNPAARALASRRSMNIGIVSFGLAQFGPSVALTGIADEARRSGYATNLVTLGAVDRSSMRAALDHLVADLVDGIVVLAPLTSAVHAIEGFEAAVPLVAFEPGGTPPERRSSPTRWRARGWRPSTSSDSGTAPCTTSRGRAAGWRPMPGSGAGRRR